MGHVSAKYQGYSLTFWPTIPHFHHCLICNQNQSMSILVIFRQIYQGYSLTFRPQIAHFHHYSICNQNQSFSSVVICWQKTKVIALLFGQKSLNFITFQSAIKINQFQFWSFVGKIPRLQPYFWPKIAQLHHFSICNQNQSMSIWVISRQNTKVIALLFGQQSLIFITV